MHEPVDLRLPSGRHRRLRLWLGAALIASGTALGLSPPAPLDPSAINMPAPAGSQVGAQAAQRFQLEPQVAPPPQSTVAGQSVRVATKPVIYEGARGGVGMILGQPYLTAVEALRQADGSVTLNEGGVPIQAGVSGASTTR